MSFYNDRKGIKNSLGLKEEIVKCVDVNVDRCRRTGKERSPLPSVILCIEQEVCADDCHTNCDCDENKEYEKHKSVDVVNLVGPERCEDEVPESKRNKFINEE